MFFDIHVFGKAGIIVDLGTSSDIILGIEIIHGFLPQLQALFKIHPVRKSISHIKLEHFFTKHYSWL